MKAKDLQDMDKTNRIKENISMENTYKKKSKRNMSKRNIIRTLRFFWNKYTLKPNKYFLYDNEEIRGLIDYKFSTWNNERYCEIPIIEYELKRFFSEVAKSNEDIRILEIGNTYHNYHKIFWSVIDKYEKSHGVINMDIRDYIPGNKFDLIFSISTFEHIGIDDEPNDNTVLEAIQHTKSLLTDNGILILTFPIGYNKVLDEHVMAEQEKYDLHVYKKYKKGWKESNLEEIKDYEYNKPYDNANGLVIVNFTKRTNN